MRIFTLLLFLSITSTVAAQNCTTVPGMSPTSTVPICGSTTFNQNTISSCTGPDITALGCFGEPLTTSNSAWYQFHCYQDTLLGFTLTPQSGGDDYDWTVFDITGHANPNDVYTDLSLQISTNLSGTTGPTGCNLTGVGNINCAGATPEWNALIPLIAGHDYLLMVTNWSNSGLGYGLTINGGSTGITNNVAPFVDTIITTGCNPSQLTVLFSEDIRCNTVTPTGSEFLITPGNFPVNAVTSLCSGGSNAIIQLIINLQNPLPSGNYNLVVNNGSDGNTFRDACDVDVVSGSQIPFTVVAQAAPVIDTITYTGCAPTVLNLTFSNPILCSSITASGTEFTIPGGPAVTTVQTACSGSPITTNTLQVTLQNPLPQGNYQFIISNGTDGNTVTDTCNSTINSGYSFPFTIASLTPAPIIQTVSFNECQPNKVILNFDKPVSCNSLTALGTEFSVTPGTWPITAVNSGCAAGVTTQVTLTLQNNLPAGNFNININAGSDANTIADTCFSFVANGYSKPFVTTLAARPVFDSVQFIKCNPSQIKVFYNHPIRCATMTANGAEYFITGPSTVNIISLSAVPGCATNNYSNWFVLQFAQPINTLGTYILHNRIATDPNGIQDTCGAAQDIADIISFDVSVKPDAAFTNVVRWGCVTDSIDLSHPGGAGVNSWIWNFSDGTSMQGQNASHNFPATTPAAGAQLIVSNGFCSDTSNVSITLDNAFNAVISPNADTSCIGLPITFSQASTGNNLQYEWQFGDNSNFFGQDPPPHTYATSNDYTVYLIATNNHGCKDSATTNIYATPEPIVNFSGLNSQYCTSERINLSANVQGNISSYTWNNGNNTNFQNSPTVSFSYTRENNYTITLSANDKFCGLKEFSNSTMVYKVPVFTLGEDTTLCPQMRIQIGLPSNPAFNYLWSNGAVSSQILTALNTDTYELLVDNNGCKGRDKIEVEVLAGCLIRVPGAFTPNNDGINDRLKAINAFLATNFSLRVYNRFGQLLFSTKNPLEGWDGKFKGQVEGPGTFVWQLSYTDPWTNQPVFQKGTSILIR